MKKANSIGVLVPIGGGEDKQDKMDVLSQVLALSGKKNVKVCLITVATDLPKEVADDYKRAFKVIGNNKVSVIHFEVRSLADEEKHLKMVKGCDVILFSGGDQLKLSSLLGGTQLLGTIKERYLNEKKFVVAGTSAGAAAMSDTMIISGSSQDALIKGELELTNGLDFINGVFIDTHFTQRGRFGRLIQTITYNPGVLGIGLGEDTAIIIRDALELEVIGSGLVVIADGTEIMYTDLMEIDDGQPITVEGIKFHVLGPGKRFLLKEKQIIKVLEKTKTKHDKQ